jgi:AraC-like DNA-binding protein
MSYHCGPPPKLSAAKIRRVLQWHARTVAFRAQHGTARDLANRLHVSVYAVQRALQDDRTSATPGTVGRKRLLSPATLILVRRWAAAGRRFSATHLTAQELAEALGVSRGTIHDCIRRRGQYATDDAQINTAAAHRRSRTTRRRTREAVSQRAALLQAWPRITSAKAKPSRDRRGERS